MKNPNDNSAGLVRVLEVGMNVKEFADAFRDTLATERSQAAQIDAIYSMLRVLMAHELQKLVNDTEREKEC